MKIYTSLLHTKVYDWEGVNEYETLLLASEDYKTVRAALIETLKEARAANEAYLLNCEIEGYESNPAHYSGKIITWENGAILCQESL